MRTGLGSMLAFGLGLFGPAAGGSELPDPRRPQDRSGVHAGAELSAIGAAGRIEWAVNHGLVGRVGLRGGVGAGPSMPLRRHRGPQLAWNGGVAVLVRPQHIGARVGMTGGFFPTDPESVMWHPEAGILLDF